MSVKYLSVRIDKETLDKLHFIAAYEARSANGQVIILIRKCIEDFEKKHGEIIFGERADKTIRM